MLFFLTRLSSTTTTTTATTTTITTTTQSSLYSQVITSFILLTSSTTIMDPTFPCPKCGNFGHLASSRNCPRPRRPSLLSRPPQVPAPHRSLSPQPETKHIKDAREGDATKFWFYKSLSEEISNSSGEGSDFVKADSPKVPGPSLDHLFDDDLDDIAPRENVIEKLSPQTSSSSGHFDSQNPPPRSYYLELQRQQQIMSKSLSSQQSPPTITTRTREPSRKMSISNRDLIGLFPDSPQAPLMSRRRTTKEKEPTPPPSSIPKPAKPRLILRPPAPETPMRSPPSPTPQLKSSSLKISTLKQKSPILNSKTKTMTTSTTAITTPKVSQDKKKKTAAAAIPTPPPAESTAPAHRRRTSTSGSKRPRIDPPKINTAPKLKKPRQTVILHVRTPVTEDVASEHEGDDNGVPTPATLSPVTPVRVPVQADPDDTDIEISDVEPACQAPEAELDLDAEPKVAQKDEKRMPGRNPPPPEVLTSIEAYYAWLDQPENDEFSEVNVEKMRKSQMFTYLGARNVELGGMRVRYGRECLQGWRECRSTGRGLAGGILGFCGVGENKEEEEMPRRGW